MNAFFALPFDPNLYKDVFLWHFHSGCKKNFVIVSLCVLELDEVTVGHIRETFGNNASVLVESTKLVCLFVHTFIVM